MTVITPFCAYCTHFHAENRETDTCNAFPEGIPKDIINGEAQHFVPREGDHGVVFEPKPGFEWVLEDKE